MKKWFAFLAATSMAVGVGIAPPAYAASVIYLLDQSNTTPPLPDNTPYLTVTIDDLGGIGGIGGDSLITFTVQTVSGAFTPTLGAFGIGSFGLNNPGGFSLAASNFSLPANWGVAIAPPTIAQDGYGKFDLVVDSTGAENRKDPLTFSIDVAGDSIASYFGPSSGNGGEGNAYYVAHVAGFTTSDPMVTSAWFGGGDDLVPPSVVPEPISAALVGGALLALVAIRRKRA